MAKPPLQLQLSSAIILLIGLHAIPHMAFIVDWTPQGRTDDNVDNFPDLEASTSEECDLDPPAPLPVKDFASMSMSKDNVQKPNDKKSHSTAPGSTELDQDTEILSFTNNLLKSLIKRTSYANTIDEIRNLEKESGDRDNGSPIPSAKKRNGHGHSESEFHSGGCEAKKDWISLGSDHFPRFVKSYNCTSDTCDRSLGECRPKSYTVKVLRMISPENISLVEEGCDPHLPEKLRCDWKLVPILVTTYCECFSTLESFGR